MDGVFVFFQATQYQFPVQTNLSSMRDFVKVMDCRLNRLVSSIRFIVQDHYFFYLMVMINDD